jgi:hypothetical protein
MDLPRIGYIGVGPAVGGPGSIGTKIRNLP